MHWSAYSSKLKKSVLLGLFLLNQVVISFSQNPQWTWARTAGGKGGESFGSVAMDLAGNLISTGYFYSDTIISGTNTLLTHGNYDILIYKYNATGNLLWCKSGGGINDDVGVAVCTDKNDNIYLTGYMYSPFIYFGSDTLFKKGFGDSYIIKINPQGNIEWMRSIGGMGDKGGSGICCKSNGHAVVCGWFQSDTIKFGNTFLFGKGSDDCFVTELDEQGNFLWGKVYGGSASDIASCITVDAADNIYFGGHFRSSDFILGNDSLSSFGNSDFFLVKTNAQGTVVWSNKGGGTFSDEAYGITVDRFNNVSLCGTFLSSTLSVGSATVGNVGSFDFYIACFDRDGKLKWMKSAGGIFDENAYGVINDWLGNVFVTGHFHSPSLIIGEDSLSNHGIGDLFISAYDSTGNWKWTEQLGGASDDGSSAMCTDGVGNIGVCGFLISPVIARSEFTVGSRAAGDALLLKLNMPVIFTSVRQLPHDLSVKIYPNPAERLVFYSSAVMIEQIDVIDLAGKLVLCIQPEDKNGEIDLKNLAVGMYVVRLISKENIHTEKLLLR